MHTGHAVIEKHIGETPLEALKRFRASMHIPESVPIAYAGRLDPLASGKLLLLVGEECKRQSAYHALDKEYAFSVLLGVATDTGDVLGLSPDGIQKTPQLSEADAKRAARSITGNHELPYPAFSSKTVGGKPLHVWTLEGKLNTLTVPTVCARVFRCTYRGMETVSARELLSHIESTIARVSTVTDASKALGRDFRRVEILARWNELLASSDETFTIAHFTATTGSGTYIRSLAPLIGTALGTTGLAFRIHRTKIGRYVPFLGRYGWWSTTFDGNHLA